MNKSDAEVYLPVFRLCPDVQTIWQDLRQHHGLAPAQVDDLSEVAAWRWHDAIREQSLGQKWTRQVRV